jgi:hypothetical protein
LAIIVVLAGCGKKARPPVANSKPLTEADLIEEVTRAPNLSNEQKAKALAIIPIERRLSEAFDKQEALDRKELVIPAPPGWQPEPVDVRLKLALIPQKTTIRVGEKFSYRVELQNVGRKWYMFSLFPEGSDFIKGGSLVSQKFHFYVIPPDGKRLGMGAPNVYTKGIVQLHEIFPKGMSNEQKAAEFRRMALEGPLAAVTNVALEPGEILVSRPDPPPPNRFRELRTNVEFDKPGVYRIGLVYDDLGEHPDVEREKELLGEEKKAHVAAVAAFEEKKKRAAGRVESNIVTLEVIP